MEKEFAGRRLPKVPPALQQVLDKLWSQGAAKPQVIRFALRLGNPEALSRALQLAANPKTPESERLTFLEILGQVGQAEHCGLGDVGPARRERPLQRAKQHAPELRLLGKRLQRVIARLGHCDA